jgi:hypothetical protein
MKPSVAEVKLDLNLFDVQIDNDLKNTMISFKNSAGEDIAKLHENDLGELVFDGDVSEAAAIFFEHVVQKNNNWIVATKKGLQQIIDNSEDPEAQRIANNLLSGDF